MDLAISTKCAIGVVLAAPGYPGDYPKKIPAKVEFSNHEPNRLVFHASTVREGGQVKTNGGRCFTLVGIASELTHARSEAYSLASSVSFEGGWCRSDIGANIYSQKY
jgi:phosphoribosylamine-glycine ligase